MNANGFNITFAAGETSSEIHLRAPTPKVSSSGSAPDIGVTSGGGVGKIQRKVKPRTLREKSSGTGTSVSQRISAPARLIGSAGPPDVKNGADKCMPIMQSSSSALLVTVGSVESDFEVFDVCPIKVKVAASTSRRAMTKPSSPKASLSSSSWVMLPSMSDSKMMTSLSKATMRKSSSDSHVMPSSSKLCSSVVQSLSSPSLMSAVSVKSDSHVIPSLSSLCGSSFSSSLIPVDETSDSEVSDYAMLEVEMESNNHGDYYREPDPVEFDSDESVIEELVQSQSSGDVQNQIHSNATVMETSTESKSEDEASYDFNDDCPEETRRYMTRLLFYNLMVSAHSSEAVPTGLSFDPEPFKENYSEEEFQRMKNFLRQIQKELDPWTKYRRWFNYGIRCVCASAVSLAGAVFVQWLDNLRQEASQSNSNQTN